VTNKTVPVVPSFPDDVRAAIRAAAQLLEHVSDSARLDAEYLMAHALGVERDRLLLDPTRYQTPNDYAAFIQRRLAQEPAAYIVGYRDFWALRLAVGPGVLIPRPDSETLIEAMLGACDDVQAPLRVLDLGTGPGTLLLAALSELPSATGLGVDASAAALEFARRNADAAGLSRCNLISFYAIRPILAMMKFCRPMWRIMNHEMPYLPGRMAWTIIAA
jgi:release factor glutamine methyltransferase